MSRYILTGATGHIGNNFVRYLNEHEPNAQIAALVRTEHPTALQGCTVQCIKGDIANVDFLKAQIHAGDTVVHLAACIDLTDRKKEETFFLNCTVTQRICDLCRAVGARFLYVGSVDAIAKCGDTDAPIVEPDSFDASQIAGNYGKSKAQAAQYVLDTMRAHPDFSCAILLPSAVIGPHDYRPSAIGKVLCDTLRGKAEFAIRGGYQFVDVRDVCAALHALCRSDLRDCYIVSGQNVSVCELYEAVNRDRGIQKKPILLPNFLIWLCMPFVPVLNKITVKALREPHNYCCDKAKKALGFSPTPFAKTIHDTLDWFEKRTT